MAREEKAPQNPQSPMWEYLRQEYDVRLPQRGEIIQAEVVRIGQEGMVMDIGAKREGLVPQEDLEKLDPNFLSQIQVGTRLPAYVLQPEGPEGNVILSVNLARVEEEWQEAERYFKTGEIYAGQVNGYNKGGLIVPFGQIRGFVPASQVSELAVENPEARPQRMATMVGTTLDLKVIEVDRQRQRLILSQRAAQRESRERRKERILAELKEGEIRHGRVSSLSEFGAFVDLGGADGLIHISELSYKRLAHPRELLQVGQEVEVYVLRVDQDKKRIGLSLRRLQPDPWRQVQERFQVGQIVEGTVTKITKFGAFASLDDGIEGLIHTSEIGEGNNLQEGEILALKIISIDAAHRRIGLSLKRAPALEEPSLAMDLTPSPMAPPVAAVPEGERPVKVESVSEVREESPSMPEPTEAVEADVLEKTEEEAQPTAEPQEVGAASPFSLEPVEAVAIPEEVEPAKPALVVEQEQGTASVTGAEETTPSKPAGKKKTVARGTASKKKRTAAKKTSSRRSKTAAK